MDRKRFSQRAFTMKLWRSSSFFARLVGRISVISFNIQPWRVKAQEAAASHQMRAHIVPWQRKYREFRFLSASLVLKLRNGLWRIKHPRSRAVVWSPNRDFQKTNFKNTEFSINTLTWAQLQKILPGMKNAGNGTDLLWQRKSQDSDWIHRREAKSSPRSARNRLTAADPLAAWDCHGKSF